MSKTKFQITRKKTDYVVLRYLVLGELKRPSLVSKKNDFVRGSMLTRVVDKDPDQKFAYVVLVSDYIRDVKGPVFKNNGFVS